MCMNKYDQFHLLNLCTHFLTGNDAADEPCRKYHIFDMKENQRHIDYTPEIPELFSPLCDQHEIHQGFF